MLQNCFHDRPAYGNHRVNSRETHLQLQHLNLAIDLVTFHSHVNDSFTCISVAHKTKKRHELANLIHFTSQSTSKVGLIQ